MSWFFSWYLIVTVLGWLTFPLVFRLFPGLSERGYAFSRTVGLLVWGYVFWLANSLGLAQNDVGGLLLGMLVLAGLSVWAISLDRVELFSWIKANIRFIRGVEILFFLSFAFLALVRASNPELTSAEKPMELMFINAILRSPTFPPRDAWLSGYAISYYYFGYVMTAMLAKLSGVPGSAAHNLMTALIFALTAIGAYGLLYNLLAVRDQAAGTTFPAPDLQLPLLGPLFLLVVSNAEGFLEILHRRGVLWRFAEDGSATSSFWTWLDIKDLNLPPSQPLGWVPDRYLWWWRASRVVQDYDLPGSFREIIDEFPLFSFLHADLHPHVLALPFSLLAIGIALHLFAGGWKGSPKRIHLAVNYRAWAWASLGMLMTGIIFFGMSIFGIIQIVNFLSTNINEEIVKVFLLLMLSFFAEWLGFNLIINYAKINTLGFRVFWQGNLGAHELKVVYPLFIKPIGILSISIVLGGLVFLNTWDILIAVALILGAYILVRVTAAGWGWGRLEEAVAFGLPLMVLSFFLYLPFYLGFSSQLGGVLPNLVYPTRGAHLWVMFATLWLPLMTYLFYLWRSTSIRANWRLALGLCFGLVFLLWGLSWSLGQVISWTKPEDALLFLNSQGVPTLASLFAEAGQKRLVSIGGLLTLLVLLVPALAILLGQADDHRHAQKSLAMPISFILLLVSLAALLVIGPEFLYLRDQFGTRINTIFKFYYQAWMLWALAAAFGIVLLLGALRGVWNVILKVGLLILLLVGLAYPVLGLLTRTNNFHLDRAWSLVDTIRTSQDETQKMSARQELNSLWTLDYFELVQRQTPDEAAAIRWLQAAPDGVLAEAIGGSYTGYARVSIYSGLPAVLGWPGHESQWRGGYVEQGSRQDDIQSLYAVAEWEIAQEILDRYDIRYVFVGTLERMAPLQEAKFSRYLRVAFQQGDVTIYEVP